MVRYRPGFYDPPYRRVSGFYDPPYREGYGFYNPPYRKGLDSTTPPLPPPNSHLLVASLLLVIKECPLDVSWAGNLSDLEVGKLGKIAPKARNFFNIMLVFSNLIYTPGMSP